MTSTTAAARADGTGRRARLRAGLLQAGPLAAAGIAANLGSVVVTVVLARLFDARGYGALNQLTGLFFVVSTPGSAVLVAVVRRVASWRASEGDVRAWAAAVRRRALWGLAALAAAALAAGPFLSAALGRHDQVGVDCIVVAGGTWVLLCVDRGVLQAHRSYGTLSANLLTEGGLRTALMLGAGAVGFGVAGVAAAVLLAEAGTALQARRMAEGSWPPAPEADGLEVPGAPGRPAAGPSRRLLTPGARDLVTALVALGAIAVLQNVDVIVMGREGPGAAGAYAAISVSSKALVFVALVVGGYLLPEAAIRWRAGGHALGQLGVTLAVLAGPAAVLLAVAALVPRRFLEIFFSARYAEAAAAFAPLALAMVCLSVLVVVTLYLLAVGDRWVVVLLVAGAGAATVATAAAHGVPDATALADLGVQAALTAAAALEMARVHRRRARMHPATTCRRPGTPDYAQRR